MPTCSSVNRSRSPLASNFYQFIARPDMQDAQVVACFLHIRARKLLRATLQTRAGLRVLFTGRISGVEG
jgi:hypothetical protein